MEGYISTLVIANFRANSPKTVAATLFKYIWVLGDLWSHPLNVPESNAIPLKTIKAMPIKMPLKRNICGAI